MRQWLPLVALMWLFGSAPVFADQTVQRQVKSGVQQALGSMGSVDSHSRSNDCLSGALPFVSHGPVHGVLDLRIEQQKVTNPNSGCVGQFIRVAVPYYTATKGYTGADQFVLQINLFNGRIDVPNYVTFDVTVK